MAKCRVESLATVATPIVTFTDFADFGLLTVSVSTVCDLGFVRISSYFTEQVCKLYTCFYSDP